MLKILAVLVPLAWAGPAQSATPPAAPPGTKRPAAAVPKPAELKTDQQQALYLLGASLAQRAASFLLTPADMKWVKLGMDDFVAHRPLKVDPQTVNPKLQALAQSRMEAHSGAEKRKGKDYAAKTAKEKGAKVYPSGLVMIPIKGGDGPSPKATDKVKVDYTGTLPDGKVFDSSIQRGQPAEFPLNGVIPCWTEALQQMKVGGQARIVCPSRIAYGDEGRPPLIPGGATLTFEVHLLGIVK